MNYKIAKTMLILCVVYLIGFYVLKFIFPGLLLQTITSPTMLKLGKFINRWKGWVYVIDILGSCLTFYLFTCAGCGRFNLLKKEYFFIFSIVALNLLVYYLLPQLYTHTSIALMFISVCLCKGKLLYATISFTLHGFLSQFLLSIRGFETIITVENALNGFTTLLLCLEMYVWLTLLALLFYFKENKKNGCSVSSVS